MRYVFTNEIWFIFFPMVKRCESPLGPEPGLLDRMFFEAALYWAPFGCPGHELLVEFGHWSADYNRLRHWIASGWLRKLIQAMRARSATGCGG